MNPSLTQLISIDTHYLNFGTFYSGKIFKCILTIKNISSDNRVIFVTFDTENKEFTRRFIYGEFSRVVTYEYLSPLLETDEEFWNSEECYRCWYLILPQSNNFEKSLKITLVPEQEIELGVVIKSPQLSHYKKLVSALNVFLDAEEEYSQNKE